MLRLALLFSAIVVAFAGSSAALAKSLTISYDSFLVLALVVLFFMGVFAGRRAGSWSGMFPIAIAAIAWATIGWYVAALVGPGFVPGWTVRDLMVMAVESTLLATAVGAAGLWIGLGVAGARQGLF